MPMSQKSKHKMAKHKWKFKSYFRREAYGWNGTAKASKRMKEAVSEIKKVAKKDLALAGEGVIELFVRLYPALMHIDSSSGALGTAMYNTIDSLTPILIKADWDMNTRGKQLDKLYKAIVEDGWGTFDDLRDHWGEICVYPGLAHLWADRFMNCTKDVLSSTNQYCSAVDMCLSCLVYTERYQELKELLELDERYSWFHHKFWAMALVKQGKQQEALDYAGYILSQQKTNNSKPAIDRFCESVLIDMGRIKEAYEKYGLKVPSYGTNLNIYRSICKKYPSIDKRKILLNLMEKSGVKGKWFAAAKTAGQLDIALECAMTGDSDPETLLRATRDFAEKNPEFALKVGIEAVMTYLTGSFYDPIEPIDIRAAFTKLMAAANKSDSQQWVQTELSKRVLKESNRIKANLRETILGLLKQECKSI